MKHRKRDGWNLWIEPLFALAIAVGLAYSVGHLWYFGYLPQPFFYEPFDIWADWFNVVYWAYDKGTYDSWGALYPPLTFVFLKIFSIGSCYPIAGGGVDGSAGLPARTCDWVGLVTFHGFYVLNIALISLVFIKLDRRTAPWRAFALSAGFPMAEALERANLVIIAFTCVLLAFGPLLKSARLRWLAVGLAINFKVYLISAVFPQLLRRRWKWFEGAILATIVVYLVTYAILGRGAPWEIYDNIVKFSTLNQAGSFLDVWFAVTYTALISLLNNSSFPMISLIGSRNVDLLLFILPLLLHIVQASILLAAAAAWLRPEAVPTYRLTNLGLCLALITSESGGYTQIFIFFFTFMEPWKGFGSKWAILMCYFLSIPLDIPVDRAVITIVDTFIRGQTQIVTYYIMLGPFLRPLLIMTIPFALSCVTLRQVWLDIQRQGWKLRWRYRNDFPIMVGKGLPRRPLV